MKIHRISAENFLSFRSLDLPLKSGTTVVTGPNGAGKSNLGQAVALPFLVLRRSEISGPDGGPDPLEVFEQAGHEGADEYSVSLDVELDQPWEQELVKLFVTSLVNVTAIELRGRETDPDSKAAFTPFTNLAVADGGVDSLHRGTLRVAYSARRHDRWWAAWSFTYNGAPLQLILRGPGENCLFLGNLAPWAEADQTGSTVQLLMDEPETPNRSLRKTLATFLQYKDGETEGRPLPTGINFPAFLDTMGPGRSYLMTFSPGITVEYGIPVPRSVGELIRALSRGQQADPSVSNFGSILAEVRRRSLVLTDNRRLPLERRFPLDLLGAPVELRDGSGVAAELYRLKNGTAAEQERFEDVRKVFRDITQLDVHLHSQPAGDGALTIDVLVGDPERARIATFAGAGAQEALLLATLLAGEPGRVVVLDEPAVNLHPTMQRRLVRHVTEIPGIVITHSADLVPYSGIADLERIVRLSPGPDGTRVSRLTGEHRSRLDAWLKNLLVSDVRSLLFASAVVLCEGSTDLAAFGRWWRDGVDEYGAPEAANIAMIDVQGQASFGGYINYLQAYGIPWTVVADGPALRHDSKLAKQLTAAGLAPTGERPAEGDGFEAWRKYWGEVGVFTVADRFGDDGSKSGEIEAFLARIDQALLTRLQAEHGERAKPRVGAAFADAHPLPAEARDLYRKIREHLQQ